MKWSGLIRPPQLQHTDTDSGNERTATWLELFFDLAFVLVVAELAVGLRDDRTLGGVLVFAGLFTSVWWAWAGFTFYANRFDTDDVVYRLAKLGAMLAVGPGWPPARATRPGRWPDSSRFAMPPSGWCWSPSTCVGAVASRQPAAR